MQMKIAIIGGSGLDSIDNLKVLRSEQFDSAYGAPSGPVTFGEINGAEIVFMPRHGSEHSIPPHKINYRANISVLKQLGVTHIISIAAVGGITPVMSPVKLVFPDQIIDYTWGREHTYSDGEDSTVSHVDFSYPYDDDLRRALAVTAASLKLSHESTATYAATQGPRLETAAEIARMERDGCDIVGMTGMPEAALARELDIAYAHCAFVVNWAAGKGDGSVVSMDEINRNLVSGSEAVRVLLAAVLPQLL
jgi:5'-deoxy-5'-methylthioadenosine phosphorylase